MRNSPQPSAPPPGAMSTSDMKRSTAIAFPKEDLLTDLNPLGRHWDELPASTRRFYHDAQAVQPQLTGQGAPRPAPDSNEVPLIKGHMRTFPDQHPSFGSVKNAVATGCPAIVHKQMDSDQWKSTYQATINDRHPTFHKRREGKRMAPALFGSGDLYAPPRPSYTLPQDAPPTVIRDMRVFKHMGTLTRSGQW